MWAGACRGPPCVSGPTSSTARRRRRPLAAAAASCLQGQNIKHQALHIHHRTDKRMDHDELWDTMRRTRGWLQIVLWTNFREAEGPHQMVIGPSTTSGTWPISTSMGVRP